MTRIDEIKARLQAAPDGPWDATNQTKRMGPHRSLIRGDFEAGGYYTSIGIIENAAAAALIAAAPTDLSYLLSEVESLTQQLTEARAQIKAREADQMDGAMDYLSLRNECDKQIVRAEKAEAERVAAVEGHQAAMKRVKAAEEMRRHADENRKYQADVATAALADNAALLDVLVCKTTHDDACSGDFDDHECECGLNQIRTAPHPGAPILKALEAAEKALKKLEGMDLGWPASDVADDLREALKAVRHAQ